MTRSEHPLQDRMIFAHGTRRSGTWWLQRILVAHPLVSAVPNETYFFKTAIEPLLERFQHGLASSTIPGYLHAERQMLIEATRVFCDTVLSPYLEPGARHLCERSPGHAEVTDLLAELYPDGRQVHIIRDGRDVARSLVAHDWGPDTIAEAAREWRDTILRARAGAPSEGYREIRYEALLADPRREIEDLFRWLGLPVEEDAMTAALEAAGTQLNQDPRDSRLGAGKWRGRLSEQDLADFEAEAGDLLRELGYGDEAEPVPAAQPPAATVAVAAGPSARERTSRLVRRLKPGALGRAEWRDGNLDPMARAQLAADALLTGLHTGRFHDLDDRMSPDVKLRIVDLDDDRTVIGRAAALRALGEDPGWRGRQVRGDVHPARPVFGLVVVYEAEGGDRHARVISLHVTDGVIEQLTVYRF